MKSLYDHYCSLTKSYYDIPIRANELFGISMSKFNCQEFMDYHFEKGRKKKVFTISQSFENEYRNNGKHTHTVALYLMGLLMEGNVSPFLKTKLNQYFDNRGWYDYKYTWFLACLYHDVTSVIEKNSSFSNLACGALNSMLFEFSELLRFPKETYANYLKYRKSNGQNEHGIIAGSALFDQLYDSFIEQTKDHDWKSHKVYQKGNLKWRKEHIRHFAYVCDAVCCHNIWLAPEKDKELCNRYKNADLDELIVCGDTNKLFFEEFPLQFMLCLLDTIEPTKRFASISPDTILKNIFINITDEKIAIAWNDIIKNQPQFWNWLTPIVNMVDWMKINISPCQHKDDFCFIELSWDI